MSLDRTLKVDLRIGETVLIGSARVRLEEKSGQRARLAITAPPSVSIETPPRVSGIQAARMGVRSLVRGS